MASLLRQIVVLAALAGGAGWAIQTQFPQEAAGDGEASRGEQRERLVGDRLGLRQHAAAALTAL